MAIMRKRVLNGCVDTALMTTDLRRLKQDVEHTDITNFALAQDSFFGKLAIILTGTDWRERVQSGAASVSCSCEG